MAKGIQDINNAKAEIQSFLDNFDSPSISKNVKLINISDFGQDKAGAEDIVKAARELASSSAQLSSTNGSQDSVESAMRATRKASEVEFFLNIFISQEFIVQIQSCFLYSR